MNQLAHLSLVSIAIVGLFLLATSATGLAADEADADFVSLFDGRTLKGWEGDKRFWRVEDGIVIGQTTADNPAEHNTFLIYRDGEYADFELRFAYQVEGYNSGVQYRSVAHDDYVVSGYQADFEARWHDDGKVDRFSGMFFEEKGRMFLGQRGEAVIVRGVPAGEKKPTIDKIGTLGDPAELEKSIKRDDWNEYTIIARGFQFTHIINGRVMAIGLDEDPESRRREGLFAFQLHSGPPMQIKIKDLRVRRFD